MAINKLKIMLSFMKEVNNGNMPTASDYGITDSEFYDIIDACQNGGFITGAAFVRGGKGNKIRLCYTEGIKLTVKGLEYLQENSTIMRTYRGLQEIRDWLDLLPH